MSPDNPQDPQKGKVDEGQIAEDAKASKEATSSEAAAQPEPKPKKPRAKKTAPAAEEKAAAATGIDKVAAASAAEGGRGAGASEAPAEPKRRRPKKEDQNPEGTQPEGTKKAATAKAAVDKPAREAAEAVTPQRKRDRRRHAPEGVLVQAQAKYVRTSARKARLVCDHIRGKDVAEARAILAFTPRAAAKPWLKLLESAVANAEHNHELIGEDLRIAAVHADEGPTLKRFRPRAMGRATQIRKRTSHLTITLTPKES
jgi:ribosomal protein L22